MTPKPITDWEELYQNQEPETMPWYRPDLDQDFAQIIQDLGLAPPGSVLDIGSGPGTQAFALAARGFTVTGTDISPSAVKKARKKAAEKGLTIEFIEDDILNTLLTRQFDLVLDRGCFHVIHLEEREIYVNKVFDLIKPGGFLLLKTFCHKENSPGGPYRFDPLGIKEYFKEKFYINYVKESIFDGVHEKPLALVCVIQKP